MISAAAYEDEGSISPPSCSRTRVATAVLLGLLALAALPACGLIGGGDEVLAEGELTEAEQFQKDVESADSPVSAETVRAANLTAEIVDLKKQIADAETQTASGLISLERARLEVIRHAQQNLTVYPPEYQSAPLVWEVFSAEEEDEFFYIKLTYRPFGEFSGTEGLEEFLVGKTGKIELSQILELPDPKGAPREKPAEEPKAAASS